MGTIFVTFSESGNFPEDALLMRTDSGPHVSEIYALIIEDDSPSHPILFEMSNNELFTQNRLMPVRPRNIVCVLRGLFCGLRHCRELGYFVRDNFTGLQPEIKSRFIGPQFSSKSASSSDNLALNSRYNKIK